MEDINRTEKQSNADCTREAGIAFGAAAYRYGHNLRAMMISALLVSPAYITAAARP